MMATAVALPKPQVIPLPDLVVTWSAPSRPTSRMLTARRCSSV